MGYAKRCSSIVVVLLSLESVELKGQTESVQLPISFHSEIFERVLNLSSSDAQKVKCRTGLIISARIHWSEFPPSTQMEIGRFLQRPALQKSRLSRLGFFRIHYDTVGVNTPALLASDSSRLPDSHEAYIDSVDSIFTYCWHYEIDTLGYGRPPQDNKGGGPEYDIYVQNLPPGNFGETAWEDDDLISTIPNSKYGTYIRIDNDFQDLRTWGINALKVTAAHEFHHAIQIGVFGFWSFEDFYFNELTSVWMEDMVFTEINDYFYDVREYFSTVNGGGFRDNLGRALPFTTYGGSYYGYERSIWAHFLAKRFGRDIMLAIWNGTKSKRPLESMRSILSDYGGSLESEFALFSYWNFFTEDRADPARFYPEGAFYPRFDPNVASQFTGNTTIIATEARALSTQFYELAVGTDTVTAIVPNVDVVAALNHDSNLRSLQLRWTSGVAPIPYQTLSSGLKVTLTVQQMDHWRSFYLSSITKSDIPKYQLEVSPNPLRLGDALNLNLPVAEPAATEAEVLILSPSLDLVFSDRFQVTESFGNRFVIVPAKSLQSKVASGVYFVIARVAESQYRWKVAIIQ